MTTEARKPKRRRYGRWIAALALIFCLTLAAAWHSRQRSLLEQSTKRANVQDWWIGYYWLSDHQVLFSRWPDRQGLYTYDIQTQKETFLRSLSRAVNKPDSVVCFDSLYVSPDGTRLLWSEFGEEAEHGAWMDGSHYFTCVPRRYPGSASFTQVRWTSDSRHWVAFVSDRLGKTQAMLYDDDSSHRPKTVPTVASSQFDPLESMGLISTQSLVLGDHILACQWFGNQSVTPAVDILDIGIGSRTTGMKTYHVQLPPNVTIQEMVISPQGDQVAWHLSMQAIPVWAQLLQRWVPRIHVPGPLTEGVWVSRIDGTHWREIGSRDLKADEKYVPQLDRLRWVPGNKSLSFMYGLGLYTVPVE